MTYVETSARASSKGVKDAFEVAALAALGKLNKQQMKQQQLQVITFYIYLLRYAGGKLFKKVESDTQDNKP